MKTIEKEKEECPVCNSVNSIRWNKIEIEIGDKNGTVADISFKFCYECGHREFIEWYD